MGPTAAGKSTVALRIAAQVGAEIVSVDSMQVYRGMDIGTAKPTPGEQAEVRHHMIDLVEPADAFSVAEFQGAGRAVLDDLEERGAPALIVGGSGLHFRALVDPLEFPPSDPKVRREVELLGSEAAAAALLEADPEAAAHVDMANPRRVIRALEILRLTGDTPSTRSDRPAAVAVREYTPLRPVTVVGVDPGALLPKAVEGRFDTMLSRGLLEEVAELAPRLGTTARHAVGYKQLAPVVAGEWRIEEGRRRAIDATRALAARQRTYFRRDPRISWMQWHDDLDRRVGMALATLREAGWSS